MKQRLFILSTFMSIIVYSCKNNAKSITQQRTEREAIVYYLYHPALISDTFCRMVYNIPVDCRGIDIELNKLYFLFKRTANRAAILQTLALDTNKIEFAPCETGECNFGGMQGNIDGYYAFRMDVGNLKANTNHVFNCKLKKYALTISMKELLQSMDTLTSHNTPRFIVAERGFKAANIGSYISLKDKDPVIKKLAAMLCKNLSTNEEKAQKMLDFVSNEIDYSYEDHWYQSEITKRSHEILISGLGDCSSKSILYASLLEQCDIPYCLLYYSGHVNVGVMGNFNNKNQCTFTAFNKTYHMAEITVENFKIGESMFPETKYLLSNCVFYQVPTYSESVFSVSTNKPVNIENLDENEYVEVEVE